MISDLKKIPREKKVVLLKIILIDIFLLLGSLSRIDLWEKVLCLTLVAIITARIVYVLKKPELIYVHKMEKNKPTVESFIYEINALSDSITFKDYSYRFGINPKRPAGIALTVSLTILFCYTFMEGGASFEDALLSSFFVILLFLVSGYAGTKSAFNKLKRTKYFVSGSNSKRISRISFEKFGKNTIRIKLGTFSLYNLIIRNNEEEINEVYSFLLKAKEIKKIRS